MAFPARITTLPFSHEKDRVAIDPREFSIFSDLLTFLAPPTRTEIQACWELCRLQNGMGCATVFLPVGKNNDFLFCAWFLIWRRRVQHGRLLWYITPIQNLVESRFYTVRPFTSSSASVLNPWLVI